MYLYKIISLKIVIRKVRMYERGYSEEVGLWSAKGRRVVRVIVISVLYFCMILLENKVSKNILKYKESELRFEGCI